MRKFISVLAALLLAGCAHTGKLASSLESRGHQTLTVISEAFANGKPIPITYTADGQNISPPLKWSPGPQGTTQYLVTVEDADTRGAAFVHWTALNLPATVTSLAQRASLPGTAVSAAFQTNSVTTPISEAENSKGFGGYVGPEPPPGELHHYHFEVFALDGPLNLTASADRQAVLNAMQGHVLAKGELVGTYYRVEMPPAAEKKKS